MRGFGEAASENWDEAISYMERFIQYNPKSSFGYLSLATIYANAGRIQDARKALEKGTKGWPPTMKSLQFVMTLWPFKELKTVDRFAAGYLQATADTHIFTLEAA